MSEQNLSEVETTTELTVEQGTQTPQQDSSADLLSRVTAFEKDNAPKEESENNSEPSHADTLEAEIANIEDPGLRAKYEQLRKNLVSGTNNKFQEIATLRKEMQTQIDNLRSNNSQDEWTPERVQQLANDPKFIAAAQKVSGISNSDDEEYSALSDSERRKLDELNIKIAELEKINQNALRTQQQQIRDQQHAQFESKYKNYNRKEVDQITYDMLEGRQQATPEHIYKAFKHDENVAKAYEMGRRDERQGIGEKQQLNSAIGIASQMSEPQIVPKEGQTSRSFFDEIIRKNLAKIKK